MLIKKEDSGRSCACSATYCQITTIDHWFQQWKDKTFKRQKAEISLLLIHITGRGKLLLVGFF